MDYPAALRSKLRTTNAIERCFREVRRRTRPMSAFTNDASCERIVFALVAHMNVQWSRKPLPGFTHNT
jgi:transposase-like protein